MNDLTFCGLCDKFKPLPLRVVRFEYPWGGYDDLYIEEGECEYHKTKVVAQQEMHCKHFCLKKEYAKRRNK